MEGSILGPELGLMPHRRKEWRNEAQVCHGSQVTRGAREASTSCVKDRVLWMQENVFVLTLHPQLCLVRKADHVALIPQFHTRERQTLPETSQGQNLIVRAS